MTSSLERLEVRGMHRTHLLTILGIACLCMCGCKDNPLNRQPVSGNVKMGEKPLEYGMISFISQAGPNHSTGATIQNGEFSIPEDRGLPPGSYRVQINATIHDPKLPPPPAGQRDERPGVEVIPPSYNSQSKLVLEVKDEPIADITYDIPGR